MGRGAVTAKLSFISQFHAAVFSKNVDMLEQNNYVLVVESHAKVIEENTQLEGN
jgi:hypothetical protein